MSFKRTVVRLVSRFVPTMHIRSVTRIAHDIEIRRYFKRLSPGIVLDVGAKRSPYRKDIPATRFMTMDMDADLKPDVCCDIHAIEWQDGYFDTMIATQVLEHVRDPQRAVDEIRRVLKPNGVCIASVPFIYPYHPDPLDYYRYTPDSLKYLFRDFSAVEVAHYGSRVQSVWQLINRGTIITGPFLNLLNPLLARVRFKKTYVPSGFIVFAVK